MSLPLSRKKPVSIPQGPINTNLFRNFRVNFERFQFRKVQLIPSPSTASAVLNDVSIPQGPINTVIHGHGTCYLVLFQFRKVQLILILASYDFK